MRRRAERDFSKTSTSLTAEKEPFIPGDTIAAISTPAGEGAIALVRVSGANSIDVADKIFRGKEKPSRFAIPGFFREHYAEFTNSSFRRHRHLYRDRYGVQWIQRNSELERQRFAERSHQII